MFYLAAGCFTTAGGAACCWASCIDTTYHSCYYFLYSKKEKETRDTIIVAFLGWLLLYSSTILSSRIDNLDCSTTTFKRRRMIVSQVRYHKKFTPTCLQQPAIKHQGTSNLRRTSASHEALHDGALRSSFQEEDVSWCCSCLEAKEDERFAHHVSGFETNEEARGEGVRKHKKEER